MGSLSGYWCIELIAKSGRMEVGLTMWVGVDFFNEIIVNVKPA